MIGSDERAAHLEVLRDEALSIVHHADARGCWATRGREILFAERPTGAWRRLARFPWASPADVLVRSRVAARALRLDRCNLHPTRRGGLLGIRAGTLYRIEEGRCAPIASIRGACLMNRAVAEVEDGSLFVGEYLTNAERRPIRIWRVTPDLRHAEVVFVFERPRLRHVHAVHVDPFVPGRLWVTTGDFENECFLGYSDDSFRSLELLGDGGQSWRAVGLLFERDRLAWLTDSELVQNRVVSMDRRTGRLDFHGEVASSAWYAVRTSDGAYLATTVVEPGPSIQTRRAFLLRSRDGLEWREAASFAKDALPMPWFKSGSLALPSGSFSSRAFWLSGEGVRGLDGRSRLCALAEGAP